MTSDAHWDGGRLIQERSQEAYRAELDGEPEPHVIPTLGASQLAISVVEVEMPCKLFCARLTGIPAIPLLLLGCQGRDRHPFSREASRRDVS